MRVGFLVVAAVPFASLANQDMHFLVLGDWGGATDSTPVLSSMVKNSDGMATAAKELGGIRFVLSVGDNFYEKGISGNEHSERFKTGFEEPFYHSELQVPWRSIAGNHDHHGNISAQMCYSQHSPRWEFKDLWWTFTETAPDGATSQFVMIDTEVLTSMSHDEVLAYHPHSPQALKGDQLTWLVETLSSSKADYLWVVGHHPIFSHCSHGPTDDMITNVLPLMKFYGANGMIAGHDHCMGHFALEPDLGTLEGGHSFAFVNSGAGRSCGGNPKHINDEANLGKLLFRMDRVETHGSEAGFASLSVTKEQTVVRYHADTGNIIFTTPAVKPRTGFVPPSGPPPSVLPNCRRRRVCVACGPDIAVVV